jgi:hypothetical protein
VEPDREWLQADGGGHWFRFFLKVAGVLIAVGIGVMIVVFIWSRAAYAFGFLGAFLAIALVLIAVGWLYDRRHAHREQE